MFTPREEGYTGTTVIAEGVKVEGNFKGDGDMVIDGAVHGTVATTRSVQVGPAARIEANVKAASAIIAGHVKGNINAKERLELVAGSHVEGDVTTKSLVIAEGAALNGKCNMPSALPKEEVATKEKASATKTKGGKTKSS